MTDVDEFFLLALERAEAEPGETQLARVLIAHVEEYAAGPPPVDGPRHALLVRCDSLRASWGHTAPDPAP